MVVGGGGGGGGGGGDTWEMCSLLAIFRSDGGDMGGGGGHIRSGQMVGGMGEGHMGDVLIASNVTRLFHQIRSDGGPRGQEEWRGREMEEVG